MDEPHTLCAMTCDGGIDKSMKGLIRPITNSEKFPAIGLIFETEADAKAVADLYYLHNAIPCAPAKLSEVLQ